MKSPSMQKKKERRRIRIESLSRGRRFVYSLEHNKFSTETILTPRLISVII